MSLINSNKGNLPLHSTEHGLPPRQLGSLRRNENYDTEVAKIMLTRIHIITSQICIFQPLWPQYERDCAHGWQLLQLKQAEPTRACCQ